MTSSRKALSAKTGEERQHKKNEFEETSLKGVWNNKAFYFKFRNINNYGDDIQI